VAVLFKHASTNSLTSKEREREKMTTDSQIQMGLEIQKEVVLDEAEFFKH